MSIGSQFTWAGYCYEKGMARVWPKQFFEMLPTDFTKQDAVKQAEVLGVSVKTIAVWLQKYIQSSQIERVMHGSYRKAICKTA